MKLTKRLVSAALSFALIMGGGVLLTGCGQGAKFDAEPLIKTLNSVSDFELKESRELTNVLAKALDATDDSSESSVYDQVKLALGESQEAVEGVSGHTLKNAYVTQAIIESSLKNLNHESNPTKAYTFERLLIRDYGSGSLRDLNSTQFYYSALLFRKDKAGGLLKKTDKTQNVLTNGYEGCSNSANGGHSCTASYTPLYVAIGVKTVEESGTQNTYLYILMEGVEAITSSRT